MLRFLALVVLLVVAGPATGAFAAGEAACEEGCGDPGGTADCCACPCNTRSVTVLGAPLRTPAADRPIVRPAAEVSDDAPADPEPDEILHVPRRAG